VTSALWQHDDWQVSVHGSVGFTVVPGIQFMMDKRWCSLTTLYVENQGLERIYYWCVGSVAVVPIVTHRGAGQRFIRVRFRSGLGRTAYLEGGAVVLDADEGVEHKSCCGYGVEEGWGCKRGE
jgi:hypothetical protein